MNDHERDMSLPTFGAGGRGHAESPAGEIDLGKAPALGRRARLLAGMMTAAAAVTVVTVVAEIGGTTHTGPFSPV